MKSAARLVGIFTIVVGIVGVMSPASLTAARRLYFATASAQHAAGTVRMAMGLVVILAASGSRAPRMLRALGAVMCMQALTALLLGPDRARAVLEWEAVRDPVLLRLGAAVSVVAGAFVAFAVSGRRSHPGATVGA